MIHVNVIFLIEICNFRQKATSLQICTGTSLYIVQDIDLMGLVVKKLRNYLIFPKDILLELCDFPICISANSNLAFFLIWCPPRFSSINSTLSQTETNGEFWHWWSLTSEFTSNLLKLSWTLWVAFVLSVSLMSLDFLLWTHPGRFSWVRWTISCVAVATGPSSCLSYSL